MNRITDDPTLSRLGTITPKEFSKLPPDKAGEMRPSGVWEGTRIPLSNLMPQLGTVSLATYWLLRIGCCGYMEVGFGGKLKTCQNCHKNQGFVCPHCLGARWVSSDFDYTGMTRCLTCGYEATDEKRKLVVIYDAERELNACNAWLARNFPYGVPSELSDEEKLRADTY